MQNQAAADRTTSRGAWLALLIWFALAIISGVFGLLARLPVPPPVIAGALTVALLIAVTLSPAIRAHVRSFGLRSFVAFHITRIAAGAYFLFLYRRGELASAFALPAGWGDIAVGIAAIIVALTCFPIRGSSHRIALLAWNTVGLIDILFVLSTAARLFLGDPVALAMFARLPLVLLPTFVVPIVLSTHVLIFIWWRDARAPTR